MNTQQLNGGQIGNGTPTSNKFWSAAVAVTVSAIAAFQILTGISGQVNVTAVADFTRYVGMQATQMVQVSTVTGFSRIRQMAANVTVSATATCSMLVGRVRLMASNVLIICQGVSLFFRQRFSSVSSLQEVSSVANFGIARGIHADCTVSVTSTSNFSNFGEYATDDRKILVPEEDRKIEVT
jgi:hypothetical protein